MPQSHKNGLAILTVIGGILAPIAWQTARSIFGERLLPATNNLVDSKARLATEDHRIEPSFDPPNKPSLPSEINHAGRENGPSPQKDQRTELSDSTLQASFAVDDNPPLYGGSFVREKIRAPTEAHDQPVGRSYRDRHALPEPLTREEAKLAPRLDDMMRALANPYAKIIRHEP